MRILLATILVLLPTGVLPVFSEDARAADPVVENVRLVQRTDGSGLVDVLYDVADADGDSVAVALQISDDGGTTWDLPVLNAAGDVGPGVVPGPDRAIVWNAGAVSTPLSGDLFRARVLASDLGVEHVAHSPRNVAITDFGSVDWSDPAVIERFSRADLCLVMAHHLWQGGNSGHLDVIAQLKALNPDIVVLGYVSAKSAHLSGPTYDPTSFWYKWYERTTPYFMLTTEGDVATDWPNSRLINILDPGCRQVQIETIAEMQATSLNVFDGVYWDYFNNSIWVPAFMEVAGDVDMDGDGIGHPADADEQQAFRDAQVELIHALRDTLGEDFIQFFNGQRAYGDSTFAALGDGAMYELFPTLFFPEPDMQHALDPEYQYSLFNVRRWFRTANGGPFLVLANPWINRFIDDQGVLTEIDLGDVNRAVALVTDTYSSWNKSTYSYGWTTREISLGDPLGPPVFEGPFIRRDFRYGRVEIEMTSGAYPDPFDYRIWLLGDLVQELAIPSHTP